MTTKKIIRLKDEDIPEFVSGGRHENISTAACVAGALSGAVAAAFGVASGVCFFKSMDVPIAPKIDKPEDGGSDIPGGKPNKPKTGDLNALNKSVSNYGKFIKYGKIALGFLGAAGVSFSVAALADV